MRDGLHRGPEGRRHYRPSESSKATRASASTSTRAAPAGAQARRRRPRASRPRSARRRRAAPRRPASAAAWRGSTAKAPAWFAARAARSMPSCGAVARRRVRRSGTTGRPAMPRQPPRQLGRLVVAPPEQPPPVQRHRRDQVGLGQQLAPGRRHPAGERRAPCRAGRRASAPAPSAARRRRRAPPPRRGPRPAGAAGSSRRRPRRPASPISGTPHLRQAVPAMKWVSRQQAGQSPCGRSVGSVQARQRGG